MHEGGVVRVVVEVRKDGRIAPGVLFVEIVDSLVESTLGFLENLRGVCRWSLGRPFF